VILQVRYLAQLRNAAGRSAEAVEVEEGCTVAMLAARLAEAHPELQPVLSSPTLLTFVGDEQAQPGQILCAGDEIILMTPIAGGDWASALR
jgi:molybdopterin converting factor small subunit